ncbi:anti-sigma factor family protein [Desulfocurvus sp. DL9XJH121]
MMTNVIKACFDRGVGERRGLGSARGRGKDCPELTILGGYLDGTLPEAERTAVEAHMVACSACRRVVVELYMLLGNKPASVPEDLAASLRALVPGGAPREGAVTA